MSSPVAMTTTIAEPAKPTKKRTSRRRMAKGMTDIEEVYRDGNHDHSQRLLPQAEGLWMVDSDSHDRPMGIRSSETRLGLALLSAVLLNLCFPLAGPLSAWRAVFAWVGAAPLLLALVASDGDRRPLWRGFLTGWVFGVPWYAINCYWIYQTMYLYGGLPAAAALGILLLYSLIMGLYYGLFGWLIAFVRHATGGVRAPLLL